MNILYFYDLCDLSGERLRAEFDCFMRVFSVCLIFYGVGNAKREEIWSQSVAVGTAEFTLRTQTALNLRGRNRVNAENDDVFVLREGEESYGSIFGVKNEPIVPKNAIYLDVSC